MISHSINSILSFSVTMKSRLPSTKNHCSSFYPFKTSKYLEYSFVSFQGAKIRILAQLFTPSHTFTFSTQTSFNAYKREAILFETAKRAAIYLLRTKKVLFWAKHTCIIILLWLTFAFKADHNFFFSDNTVAILKKSCHFF